MEVSCGSFFIYCGSHTAKPIPLTACVWAQAAAPRLVSLRHVNLNETKGCEVFLKSEKCGRGGKIERKKVEKGGKGRESAVFNEG